MQKTSQLNQNPSLQEWAKDFCTEKKASIDYFLKYGSSVEKALAMKVIELADT